MWLKKLLLSTNYSKMVSLNFELPLSEKANNIIEKVSPQVLLQWPSWIFFKRKDVIVSKAFYFVFLYLAVSVFP
jgi:hypothetical protein